MGLPSRQIPETTGKLSKAEINELPIRKWEGPINLIDSDDQLRDAVMQLRNEQVIGFDVETRPAFKKGISYRPSLIQMAGTDYVNIFQLPRLTSYDPLSDLLSDQEILKVGVGLVNDSQHLQSVFPFQPKKMLDLSEVTRRVGIESYGLRSLSAHFLGFRISKRAQCSNWDSRELRPFQISYAATDAWVSREIYLAMQQQGLLLAP
ncbi:MAG: 3'-5' exonuclease domain-containing protein 2 [Magnetococcales bacterium]|nr:3'-5' exonuclease domain-containing protein 2 [Magnetococcales bacterium]MBF0116622.1 3'-5' exonuclease domain-containing protein 2 [Magnetococcales bacterium]